MNLRCSTWLVYFPPINYYWVYCNGIIYHTGVYEETFDVNSEIQNVAQTMQNIEKFTSVIIREISYSNLETREIRSKLWSLLDYPGDLTTLSFTFFFQLKNVYSTRLELRPESRLWEPLLATWLVETTICKQQLQLSIYSSHIVLGFTKTECCLNISWKIRYHTRCSGTIRIKFNWVRITGLRNPIGDSHNPKARQSKWPPWKRCT